MNLPLTKASPSKISEVVVDKKVLGAFRRRAMRAYPKEYIETVWGKVQGTTAQIFVFHTMEHEATSKKLKTHPLHEEESLHDGLTLLGTLHSHPGSDVSPHPSKCDIVDAWHEGELIFGIMAINLRGSRRFSSFNFFLSGSADPLPLIIAE